MGLSGGKQVTSPKLYKIAKMPEGVLTASNLWEMSLSGRMNGCVNEFAVFAPLDSKLSPITDSLFIGAEFNRTRAELKENGITVVLNCAKEVDDDLCCTKKSCGCNVSLNGLLTTRRIPLLDNEMTDEKSFEDGAAFIHAHLSNNERVLVHCAQGISRSVAMVMYYFIRYKNMTPHQALFVIQEKRPFAGPCRAYCNFLMKTFHQEAIQSLDNFCNQKTPPTQAIATPK